MRKRHDEQRQGNAQQACKRAGDQKCRQVQTVRAKKRITAAEAKMDRMAETQAGKGYILVCLRA